MVLRVLVPASFLTLFCWSLSSAQEHAAIIERIREAHGRIRTEVFNDVAVEMKWKTIGLPEEEIQLDEHRSFVFQGDDRMMRDDGDVLASNSDYRFRVNDTGGGKEIAYLEGKKRRNPAAEAYENDKSAGLFSSMEFEGDLLADVLEDEAFVIDSIQDDEATVTIKGSWQKGDSKFEDIVIQLAPENLYQVVACDYKVRRPKYGINVANTYTYANEPFDDTNARMLVAFEQNISDYPLGDTPPTELGLHQEVEFSHWTRAPDDPMVFRLSGHGFPEPDLDALNGSISPLRLVLSLLVGCAGLLAILFGRRLFAQPKANE